MSESSGWGDVRRYSGGDARRYMNNEPNRTQRFTGSYSDDWRRESYLGGDARRYGGYSSDARREGYAGRRNSGGDARGRDCYYSDARRDSYYSDTRRDMGGDARGCDSYYSDARGRDSYYSDARGRYSEHDDARRHYSEMSEQENTRGDVGRLLDAIRFGKMVSTRALEMAVDKATDELVEGKAVGMAAKESMKRPERREIHAAIALYVMDRADKYDVRSLANIAYYMTKTDAASTRFYVAVARTVTERSHEANSFDMAMILYAMAFAFGETSGLRGGARRRDLPEVIPRCVEALCAAALERGTFDLTPKDIGVIASSIQRLQSETPPAVERYIAGLAANVDRVVDSDPKVVAQIICMLARAKQPVDRLAAKIIYYWTYAEIRTLDEGALCMLLRGFRDDREIGFDPDLKLDDQAVKRFHLLVCRRAEELAPTMCPKGVACVASYLTETRVPLKTGGRCMGVMPPTTFAGLSHRAEELFRETMWTSGDLAIFGTAVANVPIATATVETKRTILTQVCRTFANLATRDPEVGISSDACLLARAVTLVRGSNKAFVTTVWNNCVLTPKRFHDNDFQTLHQVRIHYFDEEDSDDSFVQYPESLKARLDEASSRMSYAPSKSQRSLSTRLKELGWDHVFEFTIPNLRLSLDLADPASKIAIELHGPHHFFSNIDDTYVAATLNGASQWKLDLLDRLGWRVIVVPYTAFSGRTIDSDDKLFADILSHLHRFGATFDPLLQNQRNTLLDRFSSSEMSSALFCSPGSPGSSQAPPHDDDDDDVDTVVLLRDTPPKRILRPSHRLDRKLNSEKVK